MSGFHTFSGYLRQSQTECERLLWQRLRGRQINGMKFRRQWPVGDYVVDFVCLEARVVVELDGGQHYEPAALEYDRRRTLGLESRGLRVVRFTNFQVMGEMEAVLEEILRCLVPSPQPSP
jgi:very-short-patch-repair endonuclease